MVLRERALSNLLDEIGDSLVVCGLGKLGRELFELREKRGEPNDDLITAGSMGCVVGVALGVAMNTKKKVYCLTGDGALLMKLGSLATVAKHHPKNLHIIVFDNGSHDSTGGQPTNFKYVKDFVSEHCRIIKIKRGARKNLGRPDISPEQIAKNFYDKVCS